MYLLFGQSVLVQGGYDTVYLLTTSHSRLVPIVKLITMLTTDSLRSDGLAGGFRDEAEHWDKVAVGLGGRADGGDGIDGTDEADHEVIVNFAETGAVGERQAEVKDDVTKPSVSIYGSRSDVAGKLPEGVNELLGRRLQEVVVLGPLRLE
jgi:hypothetical protein